MHRVQETGTAQFNLLPVDPPPENIIAKASSKHRKKTGTRRKKKTGSPLPIEDLPPENGSSKANSKQFPRYMLAWDCVAVMTFVHGQWAICNADQGLYSSLAGPLQCKVDSIDFPYFAKLCANNSHLVPSTVLYEDLYYLEAAVEGSYLTLLIFCPVLLLILFVELLGAYYANRNNQDEVHSAVAGVHMILASVMSSYGTFVLTNRAQNVIYYNSILNKLEVFGLWVSMGFGETVTVLLHNSVPLVNFGSPWNPWRNNSAYNSTWAVVNATTGIDVSVPDGSHVGQQTLMAVTNLYYHILLAQAMANVNFLGEWKKKMIFVLPFAVLSICLYLPQIGTTFILKEVQRQVIQEEVFDTERFSIDAAMNAYDWTFWFTCLGELALNALCLVLRKVQLWPPRCFPKSCFVLSSYFGPILCTLILVTLWPCLNDAGFGVASLRTEDTEGTLALNMMTLYTNSLTILACCCCLCCVGSRMQCSASVGEGFEEFKMTTKEMEEESLAQKQAFKTLALHEINETLEGSRKRPLMMWALNKIMGNHVGNSQEESGRAEEQALLLSVDAAAARADDRSVVRTLEATGTGKGPAMLTGCLEENRERIQMLDKVMDTVIAVGPEAVATGTGKGPAMLTDCLEERRERIQLLDTVIPVGAWAVFPSDIGEVVPTNLSESPIDLIDLHSGDYCVSASNVGEADGAKQQAARCESSGLHAEGDLLDMEPVTMPDTDAMPVAVEKEKPLPAWDPPVFGLDEFSQVWQDMLFYNEQATWCSGYTKLPDDFGKGQLARDNVRLIDQKHMDGTCFLYFTSTVNERPVLGVLQIGRHIMIITRSEIAALVPLLEAVVCECLGLTPHASAPKQARGPPPGCNVPIQASSKYDVLGH